MKRLLLITQNFYPEIGSGANRMKHLYKQLKKQGYQVHVLTAEPSYPNQKMYEDDAFWDDEELNAAHDSDIIRLKMRHEKHKRGLKARLSYYAEFMLKVHHFVRHADYLFDEIYVTSPNIFVPWGTLFFQPARTSETVLEIRDLWPDSVEAIDMIKLKPFMPLLKFLEQRMYNKADKLVVNNESFIPHINAKLKSSKPMIYIPNALALDEVKKGELLSEFTIIYTGNLGFAQSLSQLKEIARAINAEQIHFNVVAYGVHANDFKQFVEAEQLTYVTVIPTMTRKDCLTFTSRHHLSLSILKDTEVFLNVLPGKVIDSIGAGVPVISNLGGPANQLINQYDVGFAKCSATTEELIAAIISYRNNPVLWQKSRFHTEALAEQEFLWEKNIIKLIKFME
jgi:glycosyltransferase involved in cell wall biosynthesis